MEQVDGSRNGEETLASGHGLTTVDWGEHLSGDPSIGLGALMKLKVQNW